MDDTVRMELDITNSMYIVGILLSGTSNATRGTKSYNYEYFDETKYIEDRIVKVASRYRELAFYHGECSDLHNVDDVTIDIGTLGKMHRYKRYAKEGLRWYQEVVESVRTIRVLDNQSVIVSFTDSFTNECMGYIKRAKTQHNNIELLDVLSDIECKDLYKDLYKDLCRDWGEELGIDGNWDDVWDKVSIRDYREICRGLFYKNRLSKLDMVVDKINIVLQQAYRIFLDFMTTNELSDAMVDRYGGVCGTNSGCVIQSKYHSYLGSILTVNTSLSVGSGVIEDLYVDPVTMYDIDDDVCMYRYHDDTHIHLRCAKDKDSITLILDVLETMAYVNDRLIDYLTEAYASEGVNSDTGESGTNVSGTNVSGTNVSGTLCMPDSVDYLSLSDGFSSYVGKLGYDVSGYVTDGVTVCGVDRDGYSTRYLFKYTIPVQVLSRKIMASRVSDVKRWETISYDMLRLYAKRKFNVEL